MFRFWTTDSRGSDQPHEAQQALVDPTQPQQLQTKIEDYHSYKRRHSSFDDGDDLSSEEPSKRARFTDSACDVDSPSEARMSSAEPVPVMDSAVEEIEHQFGLEVLLKHNELRLINQELAKCQVALEQLRRCHLIPYPTACPTPEQMLEISAGEGPALQLENGQKIPQWAAPFGVTDGPYARHYAKWLIPDPSFDGIEPEWQFTAEATRARASFSEGRSTRNSFAEPGPVSKGRPSRANAGAKLQALSAGYPQPKEKAGPCVLKRSDGKTVKLVCLDCHRDNFSSTQGFINHCRIAHKRDFKSHDEAAMQSGQPIDAADATAQKPVAPSVAGNEKVAMSTPAMPTPGQSLVNPFARADMSGPQACDALRMRIAASLELYNRGELPGVGAIPKSTSGNGRPKPPKTAACPDVPHLSRLLQDRNFNGNVSDLVVDAKTKPSYDDMAVDDDSDEADLSNSENQPPRPSGVMRMPARAPKSPAPCAPSKRPASSKGRPQVKFAPSRLPPHALRRSSQAHKPSEDIKLDDANLSPTTLTSNNAPSLVSDDGEYDDSDDATSVSGRSEMLDADSDADVAEINLDDEHENRHFGRSSGSSSYHKDDGQHVTLMTPVRRGPQGRKARNP